MPRVYEQETDLRPLCASGCGRRVKMKGARTVSGHNMRVPGRPLYVVDEETRCWNWQGCLAEGYGRAYNPQSRQTENAHRVVYQREVGPIPDGFILHHKCHNRACVNPAHLEPQSRDNHVVTHGASGVRGVARHGSRWRATVPRADGNRGVRYLGTYDTIEEAAERVRAEREAGS